MQFLRRKGELAAASTPQLSSEVPVPVVLASLAPQLSVTASLLFLPHTVWAETVRGDGLGRV